MGWHLAAFGGFSCRVIVSVRSVVGGHFVVHGAWESPAPGLAVEGAVGLEFEAFAGGGVFAAGVGPEGVGGVLDGDAAGVDFLYEGVALDAVLLGFLVAFALGGGGGFIGGEVGGDLGEGFGGFVAGEGVGGGFEPEGVGVLEEEGAVRVQAGADEVAVGGEAGGGVVVFGEHPVLLFGGGLDVVEAGDEGALGFVGVERGRLLSAVGLAGRCHFPACIANEGDEAGDVFPGDFASGEGGGLGGFGGDSGDVLGELDVVDLRLVEVASRLGLGRGCGGCGGAGWCVFGGFAHGSWCFLCSYRENQGVVGEFAGVVRKFARGVRGVGGGVGGFEWGDRELATGAREAAGVVAEFLGGGGGLAGGVGEVLQAVREIAGIGGKLGGSVGEFAGSGRRFFGNAAYRVCGRVFLTAKIAKGAKTDAALSRVLRIWRF